MLSLRRVCQHAYSHHRRWYALGVVKHLKDDGNIVMPAAESRNFWEVIEFQKDGSVIETYKTPDILRLHPRDVHLFTNDSTMGRRAMIASRGDAILVRTETVRSVIYCDKAVLFPCRGLKETIHVSQTIKTAICMKSLLPFELKVLESLLAETARDFDKKYRRIMMVSDTVMDDVNQNFHETASELSRFIPITSKLNELQNDVQETLDAIVAVADYDDQLKALCVSDRDAMLRARGRSQTGRVEDGRVISIDQQHAQASSSSSSSSAKEHRKSGTMMHVKRDPHMKMASAILEAYEFKFLNIQSALKELSENLDQNRVVWHMQLDHQRNKVLRFNVMLSIASLCGFLSTLPAAYFGMNLHSGLEDHEGLLWPMMTASLGFGSATAVLLYVFFRFSPTNTYASRLSDMRSLRDLLFYHMDDLDQIIETFKAHKGQMSMKKFEELARECFQTKNITKEEISLLYRVLQKNQPAALEMTELVRAEEKALDMSHHIT
ncbi:hypothetical protein M9434_003201 [Picochlorum sp. BPE23]|nr:hypothetical protein M9434_003201 [Picochlorum sp. BPE23]